LGQAKISAVTDWLRHSGMMNGDLSETAGRMEKVLEYDAIRRVEPMNSGQLRPRVLLVDDYTDTREMYAEYLAFLGYDVLQATNGVQGIEQALTNQPDIILMDLSLPVMDGWEATRRLKADTRTSHIPIVALTGHALDGSAEGAEQAGCDRFITKPCLPEDLVGEIRRVLDARRGATLTTDAPHERGTDESGRSTTKPGVPSGGR